MGGKAVSARKGSKRRSIMKWEEEKAVDDGKESEGGG